MKAKILAIWLLEHPDLQVFFRDKELKEVNPSISTKLYDDLVDVEDNVIIEHGEDYILIEGVEF